MPRTEHGFPVDPEKRCQGMRTNFKGRCRKRALDGRDFCSDHLPLKDPIRRAISKNRALKRSLSQPGVSQEIHDRAFNELSRKLSEREGQQGAELTDEETNQIIEEIEDATLVFPGSMRARLDSMQRKKEKARHAREHKWSKTINDFYDLIKNVQDAESPAEEPETVSE